MLVGTCHCGKTGWQMDQLPETVTACNCTICRRYGVLWAYGHLGRDIHVSGSTRPYTRADSGDIAFHFCPDCGCVSHYVAVDPDGDGPSWTAVNTRMADPAPIWDLPVRHFDGHGQFAALPGDGRCVRDMWF